MKNTTIKNTLLAGAVLMAADNLANASLTIDLRFADGSKVANINQSDLSNITIKAWAIVKGAPGNAKPEGLQNAIFAIQSKIVAAGISGSIVSASHETGWTGTPTATGSASNLTADGVGDWGRVTNTPLTLTNTYLRIRTTKTVNNPVDWGDADSPAGSVFNVLPDGGREFLVESFVFSPTAMPLNASLQYVPATVIGGTVAPGGWAEDTSDKTTSGPLDGARIPSTGTYGPPAPNATGLNGVTINVIPEPAGLSLIGLLGLRLLRRHRRC